MTMHTAPRLRRAAAATVAVLMLSAGSAARAGEVIAHPSVELTAADVREVYTGEKQLAGGAKLVPVDNSAAQGDFLAKVLQLEAARYTSMWTKKSFREGITAPAIKGSDAEVIAFVKGTPGAVGYIGGAAAAGVKVISKF